MYFVSLFLFATSFYSALSFLIIFYLCRYLLINFFLKVIFFLSNAEIIAIYSFFSFPILLFFFLFFSQCFSTLLPPFRELFFCSHVPILLFPVLTPFLPHFTLFLTLSPLLPKFSQDTFS